MIDAIEKLDHLGVLRNAVPGTPITLGKVTLIYGENANGKSTLADLLRAYGLGDAHEVSRRKNWHSTGQPLIKVKNGVNTHIFSNGAWHSFGQKVKVFDAKFVESNVHSGHVLTPEHRQNLHGFILGEAAIALQDAYDQALSVETQAKAAVQTAEDLLLAKFPGRGIADVLAISAEPDLDTKIANNQREIAEAQNLDVLLKRPDPQPLAWVTPDLESAWTVLEKELENVAAGAEAKVREHIVALGDPRSEAWIEKGLTYVTEDSCPFCKQGLAENEIVAAYRAFFDEEYRQLKTAASTARTAVAGMLTEAEVERARGVVESNALLIDQWKGDVDLKLPAFKFDTFRDAISVLRTELSKAVATKVSAPLEAAITPDQKESIEGRLHQIVAGVARFNREIGVLCEQTKAYREKLKTADITALRTEEARLRAVKMRFESSTVAHVTEYKDRKKGASDSGKAKTAARKQLDDEMATILTELKEEINAQLKLFSARFTIAECKSTSVGATKRVEYMLDFSGVGVNVSAQKGADPTKTFDVALSEGDRRTLALAFFLAKLKKDPNLSKTLVVLDDPICSLGADRRTSTQEAIEWLTLHCEQLIVLCHDRFFLRDVRDRLADRRPAIVSTSLCLGPDGQGGVTFQSYDLSRECESMYRRSFRILRAFVDSGGAGDAAAAANALRIVLEGYMNRKFVGDFETVNGVGGMISTLKGKIPTSAFITSPRETEIDALNKFALKFHHDGSQNWKSPSLNPAEIKTYAERTLTFIQS